jgi:transposase
MESTGEYWKPVYNILESSFEVMVVNAQHLKNVPGRKTDVKDAEWIAELLKHGLLRGSFIPPLPQRDLRDLTRQRTNLVRERASVTNRLQKVLEWANLKLASVVTDVTGVSARSILKALVDGENDVRVLASHAKGSLLRKRVELEKALQGQVRDHHRFLIAQHLSHLNFLEEQIAIFDCQIRQSIERQSLSEPVSTSTDSLADTSSPENSDSSVQQSMCWQKAVELLDSIPGIARRTAELLMAEIGCDLSRFKSAAHLAKWAKLCPGNYESAGQRLGGRTGQSNTWLRSALVQAANAAVRCKNSYLSAVYRRLVARRGRKKAIVAVAHRIIIALYHMLTKQQPYRDLGASYLDSRSCDCLLQRLSRQATQLGYQVEFTPISQPLVSIV